jgi:ABC-type glycerol-3-phosphate transport system substrate-binding protein
MGMPYFNRRRFLQTAAATTLGGALAACGAGGSDGSSSGKVTINYWDWWVTQAGWVDDEIKRFQQAHPKIVIHKTTQGSNTYSNLLSLSFKSHRSPDVFMVPDTTPTLSEQVNQGWLRPLDAKNWPQQFPKGTFLEGSNTLNGKTYTAPLNGSAPWLQLYINNDVFKQAGLTNADGSVKIPRTWDDVTAAAAAITKKSNGNAYAFGFGSQGWNLLSNWMEVFVRGAGATGGAYDKDLRVGKYTYGTDRAYTDFVNLMLDWKKHNYFYPNSTSISDETARAFFERGKFGMTVGGVWNQPEWTQHQFTNYSLATLVSPEAQPKGYFYHSGGGHFAAVSTQTKHAEEAQLWLDWLYSVDAGQRFVEKGIDISVYPQVDDPKKVTFAPFAQYVATTPLSLYGPDPKVRNPQAAQADTFLQAVQPDMGTTLTGLYTGQLQDVSAALSQLAGKMQTALESAVKQAQAKGYKVSMQDYVFSDWDPTKPYTYA